MSTKLSFRARALDPSKPMPIFLEEELPDLHEYSAINRAVPQMPSGMEKEEESVSFSTRSKMLEAMFENRMVKKRNLCSWLTEHFFRFLK